MIKYEVIGLEKVSYTSKKTNKEVKGLTCHCIRNFAPEEKFKEGMECETFFLTRIDNLDDIRIGSVIRPHYNKYGGIAQVEICKLHS